MLECVDSVDPDAGGFRYLAGVEVLVPALGELERAGEAMVVGVRFRAGSGDVELPWGTWKMFMSDLNF